MRSLRFHELARDARTREALRVIGRTVAGLPMARRRECLLAYARRRWDGSQYDAGLAESEAVSGVRQRADIRERFRELQGREPTRDELMECWHSSQGRLAS